MTNILEWLEASAGRFPEKAAFADETQEITYLQLMTRARRIGRILGEKITPCTPVAFYLEKSCTANLSWLAKRSCAPSSKLVALRNTSADCPSSTCSP